MFGDFTYLKFLILLRKIYNISCRSKISSSRTFLLLKLAEVMSQLESVIDILKIDSEFDSESNR